MPTRVTKTFPQQPSEPDRQRFPVRYDRGMYDNENLYAVTVMVLMASHNRCCGRAKPAVAILFVSALEYRLVKRYPDNGQLDLEIASANDQKVNQGVLGLNATGVVSSGFTLI